MTRAVRFLATFALTLVAAGPVAAQQQGQRGQQQDTTRSVTERIRDRLRDLGPLVRPDSMPADTTVPDSLRPQEVRFLARGEPRAIEGLSDLQRDSIMLELLRLEGFVPTEYRADSARFDADSSRLELRRSAEVVQRGQRIQADTSIIYREAIAQICAYGAPVVSGAGVSSPVASDSLCYDLNRNLGIARGARTEISEGAVWYVSGDLATVDGSVYSHDAIFTDCAEEHPHYHFGAGSMKVLPNNVLIARDVTLRFGDVPVFWLPFFVQSLSQGRRSGILFPRFGINDIARQSSSYNRRIEDVGFYWAINDYLGAEMALDWHSNNWTSLRGSFDYRFNRQFFNGALTFRQFWKAEGGRETTLDTRNSWQPDERTQLSSSIRYATSSRFIESRSFDPRELNRSIDSDVGVRRRFDWGNVSLSGSRNQFLSNGTVRTTLPSLSVNLASVTLFEALPGEESWFSNATWTANANVRRQTAALDETRAALNLQETSDFTGSVSSSFSLGRFSWSQSFDVAENLRRARLFEPDTLDDLLGRTQRTARWSTSLNYQQRLVGTSSFTPGLSIAGQFARDTLTGEMVAGPSRIDFNANLSTDLFRIFPGFGAFEAIRHRLSPNFNYSYSPAPNVTPRQREVFTIGELREQNRISIGLTQTFEAKYEAGRGPSVRAGSREALADSLRERADSLTLALARTPSDSLRLVADSLRTRADSLMQEAQDTTGPRRRETGEKITLLSISTDALVYDFVQAREEGEGIQTLAIGHNIQSDLLRGLQFSFAHDLFRTVRDEPDEGRLGSTPGVGGARPPSYFPGSTATPITPEIEERREFAPFLSRVNASFSITSDSWIARLLGLGPRAAEAPADTAKPMTEDTTGAGPALDRTRGEQGLLGTNRRAVESTPSSPIGTWSASINYSLSRSRPGEAGSFDNQMVTGNVNFQPTENWSVSWATGYSFTRGEFTDHALTFTRRLHDFDANFDFFKAQNGNFSFQFRVHLRANPDLKFDYEQRDLPALDPIFRR